MSRGIMERDMIGVFSSSRPQAHRLASTPALDPPCSSRTARQSWLFLLSPRSRLRPERDGSCQRELIDRFRLQDTDTKVNQGRGRERMGREDGKWKRVEARPGQARRGIDTPNCSKPSRISQSGRNFDSPVWEMECTNHL
jgi:hypothetical protein